MSMLPPTEILKQWKLEEISAEMAIGHLIQNIVSQETRLESLNLKLYKLRTELAEADSAASKPAKKGSKAVL